jgi:hypothetical protein
MYLGGYLSEKKEKGKRLGTKDVEKLTHCKVTSI